MERSSINVQDVAELEKRLCISKSISNQIEALGIFEDVRLIVLSLTHEDPNLASLSDEHIKTLMWLNTKMPKEKQSADTIAKATLIGYEGIKNAISDISILLRIEEEKIYAQIRETPEFILISSTHANNVYNYLQGIGLSSQQIKEVFFETALLDKKALQERCETVLRYWNVDELMCLVKLKAFNNLPYYDSVEAITVAVDTLGAEKAMKFFISYPTFFREYRAKEYRKLQYEIDFYNDAMKALENFKNTM